MPDWPSEVSLLPSDPSGARVAILQRRLIDDRPLVVVVVWQNPAVTEGDAQVIQELSLHFAAVFFDEV